MGLDQSILNFLIANRVDWLSYLMLVITRFGDTFVIVALTLIAAVHAYKIGLVQKILPLWITVGGSAATTFIIKALANRARPPASTMLITDMSPSFPSGHATAIVALLGFSIYSFWEFKGHRIRKILIPIYSVLIILVGFSRLYLGVHYFSDVLAGYGIGLIWIFAGIKLEDKIKNLINWQPKSHL